MIFSIENKKLVWDFDENKDASKLLENNLYIENIWNMKDTVGYTDTCVSVSILSDHTFYFITFNGLGFTMEIKGNEIKCIQKQITK